MVEKKRSWENVFNRYKPENNLSEAGLEGLSAFKEGLSSIHERRLKVKGIVSFYAGCDNE